jgi:hypothetical protein
MMQQPTFMRGANRCKPLTGFGSVNFDWFEKGHVSNLLVLRGSTMHYF